MLRGVLFALFVAIAVWLWFQGQKPRKLAHALPEYDFIVVGSGSAGGVIASRLSEDPRVSVLLLEAGSMDPWNAQIPGLPVSMLNGHYDWKYQTQPSKRGADGNTGRRVGIPRGKVLGGTSQLNWMYYHRGHKGDYDGWAAEGNEGWAFKDVEKYFDKLEDVTIRELQESGRATGGPVGISYGLASKFGDLLLQGLSEVGQTVLSDANTPEVEGFMRQQANTKDGRRQSTAESYIRPNMHRKNFHVVTDAIVSKILFNEAKEAIGVSVKSGEITMEVRARKEVILSAGAYNSPQLLMWSGVGPKKELEKAKVKPILVNENVGQDLEDHVMVLSSVQANAPIAVEHAGFDGNVFDMAFVLRKLIGYFLFGGDSQYGKAVFEVNGMLRSGKKPELNVPDIQLYLMPTLAYDTNFLKINNYDDQTLQYLSKMHKGQKNIISILVGNLHPETRGSVTLNRSDPYGDPIIDYDVISEDVDVDVLVEGFKKVNLALTLPNLKKYNITAKFAHSPHCQGMHLTSTKYFRCLIQHNTITIYHPTSTCRMGTNPESSVVDSRLKVHGVKKLRVADASVMPHVPSGNTNAPTMMIGEKAADMVKQEHGLA